MTEKKEITIHQLRKWRKELTPQTSVTFVGTPTKALADVVSDFDKRMNSVAKEIEMIIKEQEQA